MIRSGARNMLQILASEDIAELVQAFEQSGCTVDSNRPLLVRSDSGGSFKTHADCVARLLAMIQNDNASSHIEYGRLVELLGVESAVIPHIIEDVNGEVYFALNGQDIIPDVLVRQIFTDLRALADNKFVNLSEFSRDRDIDLRSLQTLMSSISVEKGEWYRTLDDDGESVVCTPRFARKLESAMCHLLKDSSKTSSIVDFSQHSECVGLPKSVIETLAQVSGPWSGEFEQTQGTILYRPSGWAESQRQMADNELQKRILQALAEIKDHGFIQIETRSRFDNELEAAVTTRLGKEAEVIRPSKERTSLDALYLVSKQSLGRILDNLNRDMLHIIDQLWSQGQRSVNVKDIIATLPRQIVVEGAPADLVAQIIQCKPYTLGLESAAKQQIFELEQKNFVKIAQVLEDRVLIPARLYSAGLASIKDEGLREKMDVFGGDHLLSGLSRMSSDFRRDNLLYGTREKEFSKFEEACKERPTISEIASAAVKLSKKFKLLTPPPQRTYAIKLLILRNTLEAMHPPQTRGSDVLQHALWILLAQRCEGIFISAGKDTSRMIYHYEALPSEGNQESDAVARIKNLRDSLKRGENAPELTQEVRELATRVVEEMESSSRRKHGPDPS